MAVAQSQVRVVIKDERVKVTFQPFDWDLVNICKEIPHRWYDSTTKENVYPLSSLGKVAEAFPDAQYDVESKRMLESVGNSHRIPDEPQTDLCESLPFADKLRPYQKADIEFLKAHSNVLNGLEMGLGKTVEALAVAHLDGAERVLIICPNTAKFNWRDEVDKWLPGSAQVVVDGNKAKRTAQLDGDERFVIINYEGARIHGKQLADQWWDMVVVDEAHRIKNRRAKQTEAIKSINARRKMLMTGTPIMNRPDEIWSLLNYLDPRSYSSYWRFVEEYCTTRERWFNGRKITEITGYKNLGALRQILFQTMVRRRKDEVLKDLPSQIHQRINVELAPDQRAFYDEAEEAIYLELTGDTGLTIPNAIARLMRLRQIAVDPAMIEAEGYSSAKYVELDNLLEDILYNGHKAIVYSQFRRATNILRDRIGDKYNAAYIDGGVKGNKREAQVKKFQEDESCKVFIGTIGSCKEAINLTAADYVIFLDQDWVPANNEQAAARAHRIGQLNTVNVIRLIARDTVEEGMERLLVGKQELFNQLVERDGGRMELQITVEDIKDLLRRSDSQ